MLGNTHFTYEELSTLFVQIEAILNSRPLVPLSSDPTDLFPLTPGHFLIGRPLTSLPTPALLDVKTSRLSRYQLIEQMQQHFWERWRKEFLSELQQRAKWRVKQGELLQGDMVILKEANLPPLKWKMGRIHRLYPGRSIACGGRVHVKGHRSTSDLQPETSSYGGISRSQGRREGG